MSVDVPPPPPAIVREFAQSPQPLPQIDLVVEVVAELPVRAQLNDMTRLLGLRHRASRARRYPPTILELITLVERNPVRPRGRNWDGIRALNIGYDARTKEVIVEYCVDYCGVNPTTSTLHPKRTMAAYRAPEDRVIANVKKKLGSLQKYAERPNEPK